MTTATPDNSIPTIVLPVPKPLAAPLVVLDEDAVRDMNATIAKADAIEEVTDESFAEANTLVGRLAALASSLEQQRKTVKKPVIDLGKAIDTASRGVSGRLDTAKRGLAHRMVTYQRAKEAEARRAEAERQRRIAEARREAEEAAALQAESAEDVAAREDLIDESAIVELAPPAPVVPKSNVHTRKTSKLVIRDAKALPREINGVQLLVPDERTIKRLLEAGMSIPGAELVEEDLVVARAR